MKEYILGKCVKDFQVILEGPNSKKESLLMKKEVYRQINDPIFFIDGSVDRQFVAHPDISDSLFFSVLISQNDNTMQKARDLIYPLFLSMCEKDIKTVITKNKAASTKSMLLDNEQRVIYQGENIPFLDNQLKEICEENKNRKSLLYLNGALSKSLFSFLSPYKNFSVILDNFTLYQNVSSGLPSETFRPKLYIFNPVNINGIFTIEEPGTDLTASGLSFPKNIPVHNLFKEKETATDFLSEFIKNHLHEHSKGQ